MNRKAFTITELMITTAIFVIISGGIFAVLTAGKQTWEASSARLELQQHVRSAMSRIVSELSEAGSVTVNVFDCVEGGRCSGSYIEFYVPVATDDPIAGSIFKPDGTIKWGAGTTEHTTALFIAATNDFSPDLAGRLVRLTSPDPITEFPPEQGNPLPAGHYDARVIADEIFQMDVVRPNSNPHPQAPLTLIITLHGRRTITGGRNIDVALSSQVTFKNTP